jgi:hypothetical protein
MSSRIIRFTQGKGVKNTQGQLIEVESLEDAILLLNNHDEKEGLDTWWSTHQWDHNSRAAGNAWLGSDMVALDIDYSQPGAKHTVVDDETAARMSALLGAGVCGGSFWHMTPRGCRLVWFLREPIKDPKTWDSVVNKLKRVTNGLIIEQGLFTPDSHGFYVDDAALDRYRILFTPRCLRNGVLRDRQAVIITAEPFAVEDLLDIQEDQPLYNTKGGLDFKTMIKRLNEMPKGGKGGGDGSSDLMRVCRRAYSWGVRTDEDLLTVLSAWNFHGGQEMFTEDDILKRFVSVKNSAKATGLVEGLPINKNGGVVGRPYVLERILREDIRYRGKFRQNELSGMVYYGDMPISSSDVTRIMTAIDKDYQITPAIHNPAGIQAQLEVIAKDDPFNPLVDYLRQCRRDWDGRERSEWLARDVLFSDHTLAREYIRKTMIAAVARAMTPGCKVDTVMILIGAQGARKSTFWKTLAGDGENRFADTSLNLRAKNDLAMAVNMAWFYELSELDSYYKFNEQNQIRSIITSSEDTIRKPYDKNPIVLKRRGIFVGTTNSKTIIQDQDGDRRWWALEVCDQKGCAPHIHIDLLALARNQLWGEAVAAFEAGESWDLPADKEEIRKETNRLYAPWDYDRDNLHQKLQDFEEKCRAGGQQTVSYPVGEILKKIGIIFSNRDRGKYAHLVPQVLSERGYTPVRERVGGRQENRAGQSWRKDLVENPSEYVAVGPILRSLRGPGEAPLSEQELDELMAMRIRDGHTTREQVRTTEPERYERIMRTGILRALNEQLANQSRAERLKQHPPKMGETKPKGNPNWVKGYTTQLRADLAAKEAAEKARTESDIEEPISDTNTK